MTNPMFDHERLDVYQVLLHFVGWATVLIDEVKAAQGSKASEACDHLDRASLSALFNTAEGNGKRQRQTRAKFFDGARGSATECAACLDALVAKGAAKSERVIEGKEMLHRSVSMLCKLVDRFSDPSCVKEDEQEYQGMTGSRVEDETDRSGPNDDGGARLDGE